MSRIEIHNRGIPPRGNVTEYVLLIDGQAHMVSQAWVGESMRAEARRASRRYGTGGYRDERGRFIRVEEER